MPEAVHFKRYCWSVGTTSYRTDNFNMNIERQLELLDEFRKIPGNEGVNWIANNKFQKAYYDFLKQNDFVTGDAPRPDKDAREKTSGLVDIGLLDDNRNLTEAGRSLLKIAEEQDFASDNFLEIPKDSFVYFKQLLKTHDDINGNSVRQFIVFLYVVSQVDYLTDDEFTYLLPLCVDEDTTRFVVEKIKRAHEEGALDYEDVILSVLMGMDNYVAALDVLQNNIVTENILCEVGMNRKSAKYDKPYFKIYQILKRIVFGKEELALELYNATRLLKNSKVGVAWRKRLFSSTARSVIVREGNAVLNNVPILKCANIGEFNEEFFKLMHLYKAEATLSDYFDLNRRYFKATDVVIFEDGQVKLDVLPMCYVSIIADELIETAFEQTDLLPKDVTLKEIDDCFDVSLDVLYDKLGRKLGKSIADKESAKQVIKDERYERFNKLIDEKFSQENLIKLLTYFEERNDDEIRRMITDNADIPTMFEYVLGISWYIISERQGDVLEYMNLSLEADLLPKTHAGGGEADIVWQYPETASYPKHTLLIEATLADGTNQRRMEMEPVSRHLGEYLLAHPDGKAYCVFITTYLNINVVSDFRSRRYTEYFDSTETHSVPGMKILPLKTEQLKKLLEAGVKYPWVYKMLDNAYKSDGSSKNWYDDNIVKETLKW